jgi:hypothetical protein
MHNTSELIKGRIDSLKLSAELELSNYLLDHNPKRMDSYKLCGIWLGRFHRALALENRRAPRLPRWRVMWSQNPRSGSTLVRAATRTDAIGKALLRLSETNPGLVYIIAVARDEKVR